MVKVGGWEEDLFESCIQYRALKALYGAAIVGRSSCFSSLVMGGLWPELSTVVH